MYLNAIKKAFQNKRFLKYTKGPLCKEEIRLSVITYLGTLCIRYSNFIFFKTKHFSEGVKHTSYK
jgi:hypothetical protein